MSCPVWPWDLIPNVQQKEIEISEAGCELPGLQLRVARGACRAGVRDFREPCPPGMSTLAQVCCVSPPNNVAFPTLTAHLSHGPTPGAASSHVGLHGNPTFAVLVSNDLLACVVICSAWQAVLGELVRRGSERDSALPGPQADKLQRKKLLAQDPL